MCDSCEWENELEELDDLCGDPDYEWANDTLSGIAENVENRKHITERQIAAIGNIRNAVESRRD